MNKRNNTAEDIIKELMTPVGEKMERFIDGTSVLRFIQYFPKGGNQRMRKILCHNKDGWVHRSYEATYVDAQTLKNKLNIPVIEDYFYIPKKDFDFYLEKEVS